MKSVKVTLEFHVPAGVDCTIIDVAKDKAGPDSFNGEDDLRDAIHVLVDTRISKRGWLAHCYASCITEKSILLPEKGK